MRYEQSSERSADPAVEYLRKKAKQKNIETGWDRYDTMQESCGFGELGLCCRTCMMGPCRINPFGEEPTKGICGIDADGMVARNLCKMIATGASAHSDHGMHIVEVLEKILNDEKTNFKITDTDKLEQFSLKYNLHGSVTQKLARLLDLVEQSFFGRRGDNKWFTKLLPDKRLNRLIKLGVLPRNVDPAIRETLHRTHIGVDSDYMNLLLGALKCSLSDLLGMDIASNLTDILLGTPKLKHSMSNLGVIDEDSVNIAVHGHNPLVSASIVEMVPQFVELAKDAGAKKGINIVGICCTGNELLLRNGVPLATNAASQEIAILTGAIDAMVVDVQCIMPSLADICECFHTKLITTMSIARIPKAMHVEFEPETANESASKIISVAIEAYKDRNPRKVDIPKITQETLVGFSPETIVDILSKINEKDPLHPLVENISKGNIYGIVLFAGCNNYKVKQDYNFLTMARELLSRNVLLVATGCAAGAYGKGGLLSPDASEIYCGYKLKGVLKTLGKAAGLDKPLPPVWHMGSCVDNSRVVRLIGMIAQKLGLDIDQLPVAASAPEAMSEKSIAIGTYAVAIGVTTHIGVIPPIMGGKNVTDVLTDKLNNIIGSSFIVETDPKKASEMIFKHITEKRINLELPVESYIVHKSDDTIQFEPDVTVEKR